MQQNRFAETGELSWPNQSARSPQQFPPRHTGAKPFRGGPMHEIALQVLHLLAPSLLGQDGTRSAAHGPLLRIKAAKPLRRILGHYGRTQKSLWHNL